MAGGMVGGLSVRGLQDLLNDRAAEVAGMAGEPSSGGVAGPRPGPVNSSPKPGETSPLDPRGFDLGQYMTPLECAVLVGGLAILGLRVFDVPFQMPGFWDGNGIFHWPAGRRPDDLCPWPDTTSTTTTTTIRRTKGCDFARWPQACGHYSSVFRSIGGPQELWCPYTNPGSARPATSRWNSQHVAGWRSYVNQRAADPGLNNPTAGCQRDEFPFLRFMGLPNTYGQMIRL